MEKYLSGEEIDQRGDPRGVADERDHRQLRLQPVLCGSVPSRTKGVQPLLDAVVDLSTLRPWMCRLSKGSIQAYWRSRRRPGASDDSSPFSALVFKIMTDPFVGQLAYVPRLLWAMVETGKLCCSTRVRGKTERDRADC